LGRSFLFAANLNLCEPVREARVKRNQKYPGNTHAHHDLDERKGLAMTFAKDIPIFGHLSVRKQQNSFRGLGVGF